MIYYFNSECRILHVLSHLIANCLYFCNDKISAYKRCIGVKNQDDMKEKESFTANIGIDEDFSYEGRDAIAFSYCSILGIRTLYTRVNLFFSIYLLAKKKKQLFIFYFGSEGGLILISFGVFFLFYWFLFFFGGGVM